MRESRVVAALRALADNDRQMTAPPSLEASLIEAFRANQAKRASLIRRQISLAAVCAVATAAAIVIAVMANRPPKTTPAPPREVANTLPARPVPQSAQSATRVVAAAPSHHARPAVSKRVHKAMRNVARGQGEYEVVTDFFALMDPAPPLGRGEILRVQVPAATMRAVGLPVSEDHLADRIQADVLVGEEGLPRAIRFVKYERE